MGDAVFINTVYYGLDGVCSSVSYILRCEGVYPRMGWERSLKALNASGSSASVSCGREMCGRRVPGVG